MRLRVGSLFSGYRGLDMAVESVTGGRTVWVCDNDPGASRILAHHHPDVPNLGDITKVDWSTVEPVDVTTGGFPCQDVSHAGKRAGLRPDTRSGLWAHMAYAIDVLRPRLVVAENVRGLLNAQAHSDVEPCPWCVGDDPDGALRALGAVLGDLADLGYDAEWCCLRASDVGAPHGRFRVFVIAYPAADPPSLWYPFLEAIDGGEPAVVGSESGAGTRVGVGDPASRVRVVGGGPGQEPAAAHAGGEAVGLGSGLREGGPRRVGRGRPDDGGRSLLPTPAASDVKGSVAPAKAAQRATESTRGVRLPEELTRLTLLPTPAVNDMGAAYTPDEWDAWTEEQKSVHGNGNGHGKSLEIEAQRLLPTPSTALADGGQTSRSGDRKDEPLLGNPTELQWGEYAAAIARWEALTRAAPAATTTGPNGGQRLSAGFVEWMMGLPPGHVTDPAIWEGMTSKRGRVLTGAALESASRNAQLRALGNGVVPQQAMVALRLLLEGHRAR